MCRSQVSVPRVRFSSFLGKADIGEDISFSSKLGKVVSSSLINSPSSFA